MLDAVDGDRRLRFGHVQNPLHAQHVFAMRVQQHCQPNAESRPVERPIEGEAKGVDGRVVAIHIMGVFVRRRGRRLDPARHLAPLCAWIVDIAGEQLGRACRAGAVEQRGRRVESGKTPAQRRHAGLIGDVRLGQHQAVGDGGLLERFVMAVELAGAVHGIHRGDDVAEAEMVAQDVLGHQRVDDGRRIGETRGFDDKAPEARDLAALAAAVKFAHRRRQIATDGATQTARLQHHRVAVDAFQQVVVEADFAELVDKNRGVGHAGIAEKAGEQRRLATAKGAGDDVDRDRAAHQASRARSAGSRGSHGRLASASAAGHTAPK